MSVTSSGWHRYWCVTELSFYDSDGQQLVVDPTKATSESQNGPESAPEYAVSDPDTHFCSGDPAGWLQFEFDGIVDAASYNVAVRCCSSNAGHYAPNEWTMLMSIDNGNSWTTVSHVDAQTWSSAEVKSFTIQAFPLFLLVPFVSATIFPERAGAHGSL